MEQEGLYTKTAVAGIILTILSFVIYIFVPNIVFAVLFGVGIAVLVASYILLYKENKKVQAEYDSMVAAREAEPEDTE